MKGLAEHGLDLDMPLDVARAVLCAAVDARAEAIRSRYVTPGATMALVYAAKAAEATALRDDLNPSPERFPLLQASKRDDEPLADVATEVLDAIATTTRVFALVETSRLRTKRKICAAPTVADAVAAMNSEKWLDEV